MAMYATAEHRHSRAKARLTWVERMDRALKEDGYLLEAQPIRDLAGGEISQYELLIRMRGHDGDVIPPAAFLYVAERFGMIGGIDALGRRPGDRPDRRAQGGRQRAAPRGQPLGPLAGRSEAARPRSRTGSAPPASTPAS